MEAELSERLKKIAEMVPEGCRLADVGCDHGYLPVYLVLTQRISGAVAADVKTGPLMRAQEHIRQYHAESYIETRLCDGLSGFQPGECDALVIAGMGGPLMERILTEGAAVRDSFGELILSPQSDIPHFRRFLMENHCRITDEDMVLEDGKFYTILKAVPGSNPDEPWTEAEFMFGRFLLQKRHPVLKAFLERELRIRNEILEKLKDGCTQQAEKRRTEVLKEKEQICSALLLFDIKYE